MGFGSIGVPAHKLDEDLLKCLDLVHGIGQAEKAGFGSANIFAFLVDYPPGSCKMKMRSDMRIPLFFAHDDPDVCATTAQNSFVSMTDA